jgi:hypothetical protein
VPTDRQYWAIVPPEVLRRVERRTARLRWIFLVVLVVAALLFVLVSRADAATKSVPASVQAAQVVPGKYGCQPGIDLTAPPNMLGPVTFIKSIKAGNKVSGKVTIQIAVIIDYERRVTFSSSIPDLNQRATVTVFGDSMSMQRKRLDNGKWTHFNRCRTTDRDNDATDGTHGRIAEWWLSNSRHRFRLVYSFLGSTAKGLFGGKRKLAF